MSKIKDNKIDKIESIESGYGNGSRIVTNASHTTYIHLQK